MAKRDPYAALRIKEFNIFLALRFVLVFAWSMQFIVVEWQVYSLTKDPLSLGIIGLMEIIPALGMALFAGHIVDQKEKRNLFLKIISLFSLISLGLFFISGDSITWSTNTILYAIYAFVFFGGLLRSFFGPTIFSLIALIVPKKVYPNAATWSSSTWQMASILGPAVGGFTINWIGIHWSLCIVFILVMVALILGTLISKKPVLNPKIGEPVGSALLRPKSMDVAKLGPTQRAPIVIDARTAKQIAEKQQPGSFATQKDIVPLEPRLLNSGHEAMFA